MGILEIILSTLSLGSLATALVSVGIYKNKISTLESNMEKVEEKLNRHDVEINDSKIVDAAILENLKYLTMQMDKIDQKLDGHMGG